MTTQPPITDAASAIALRFWSKVDRRGDDECWPWLGGITGQGYGRFCLSHTKHMPAHRFAYEATNGPVPSDLVMDHLCRNRSCCNPRHLEPVENRTNVLRGVGISAENARKTYCKRGHPLTGRNLMPAIRVRECRQCKLDRAESYRAKKRSPRPLGTPDVAKRRRHILAEIVAIADGSGNPWIKASQLTLLKPSGRNSMLNLLVDHGHLETRLDGPAPPNPRLYSLTERGREALAATEISHAA